MSEPETLKPEQAQAERADAENVDVVGGASTRPIESDMDGVRRELAFRIFWLYAVFAGISVIAILAEVLFFRETGDVAAVAAAVAAVLGPVHGVFGVVIGFYFGSRSRR